MINSHPNMLSLDLRCVQVSCSFDIACCNPDNLANGAIPLPQTLALAAPKRQAEFIAGRYCAHLALEQLLRRTPEPVGIGSQRQPEWPASVVGSITHTRSFASAVVALNSDIRAVGIDTETCLDIDTALQLQQQILTAEERQQLHHDRARPSNLHTTLIFSAKESLYKCLFPLTGAFFGFEDARIDLQSDADCGHFGFELLQDLDAEFRRGYTGTGSYRIEGNTVHTAVLLNPRARCAAADHHPHP